MQGRQRSRGGHVYEQVLKTPLLLHQTGHLEYVRLSDDFRYALDVLARAGSYGQRLLYPFLILPGYICRGTVAAK
jgi:hypothetical protein